MRILKQYDSFQRAVLAMKRKAVSFASKADVHQKAQSGVSEQSKLLSLLHSPLQRYERSSE